MEKNRRALFYEEPLNRVVNLPQTGETDDSSLQSIVRRDGLGRPPYVRTTWRCVGFSRPTCVGFSTAQTAAEKSIDAPDSCLRRCVLLPPVGLDGSAVASRCEVSYLQTDARVGCRWTFREDISVSSSSGLSDDDRRLSHMARQIYPHHR